MPSIVDEVKMKLHVACGRVKLGACHLSPFDSTRARCKRDLSPRSRTALVFNVCLVIQAKKRQTMSCMCLRQLKPSLELFIMKSAFSEASL
jgi:hypothetical protein